MLQLHHSTVALVPTTTSIYIYRYLALEDLEVIEFFTLVTHENAEMAISVGHYVCKLDTRPFLQLKIDACTQKIHVHVYLGVAATAMSPCISRE